MSRANACCAAAGMLILTMMPCPATWADGNKQITIRQTPAGIRFGIFGEKPKAPAPTLFVFATSIEESLGNDSYNKLGRLVAKHGYVCVSLDLPCHGQDTRGNEPVGLNGWRRRLEKGEEVVARFVANASLVLDYLIKEGYTDSHKVAACGTSRGAFMALHFAAAEPRIRCVAAFAPVTDLLALREFAGLENHAATKKVALVNSADKLGERHIWLCIGNHDQRVDTDQAIAFTRNVVRAAVGRNKPASVELHVMPSPGHRVHAAAHDEAAAWLIKRLQNGK